jgi:DNA-directed RNA polymerase specialized sigma24 family protein
MAIVPESQRSEAWRLVHDEGLSMKRAAAALGVPIGRVFELLTEETARREVQDRRGAASFSIRAAKK